MWVRKANAGLQTSEEGAVLYTPSLDDLGELFVIDVLFRGGEYECWNCCECKVIGLSSYLR